MPGAESFAVFEIFGERSLTAVHVDRGDRKTFLHQFDGQMHGMVDLPVPPFSLLITITWAFSESGRSWFNIAADNGYAPK